MKKKNNLLMISSSSSLGGGTKHMFMLGERLENKFKIYYAIPKNSVFKKFLNKSNHIDISERSITIKDIKNLKKFVKFNSIDIIHAHGKGAGVIGRLIKIYTNTPLIYTFHGIHLKCHNWLNILIYIIYEFIFGWVDSQKILVSKSEEKYAKSSYIFLGKRYKIINNGVPNMPKKANKEFGKMFDKSSKKSKLDVITICRFVNQKNIKDIINIALRLPKINFSIIGDGPLWEEINSIILKRKVKNVFLEGRKKNVFKYLYKSDIYLSTSLYEGLPISILEAMSVGLPIVASDVIGNCDTIEDGKSGFLYDLNDIDLAIYHLNKLKRSFALRKKIGNEAFKRQRKIFSNNKMIENYKNLYQSLLD